MNGTKANGFDIKVTVTTNMTSDDLYVLIVSKAIIIFNIVTFEISNLVFQQSKLIAIESKHLPESAHHSMV